MYGNLIHKTLHLISDCAVYIQSSTCVSQRIFGNAICDQQFIALCHSKFVDHDCLRYSTLRF